MAVKKKDLRKGENTSNGKITLLIVASTIILALASFLAYSRTISHDFVNWDDIVYIMNNDMITAFTWDNLQKIFSSYFMGNYHPFTLLSFLLDFHFFKFSAQGYHIHNILLHVTNTVLVYLFVFYLLRKNSNVAVTVALLFALHPMHVESVAWVSERKDVLYTAYFFLSLLSYLFYIQKKNLFYLFLALIFFLFSNLSKAQAVTLPIVLVLIDYFNNRKFDSKTVFEKIPFFLLSAIFGIVAIFAQKASHYINPLGIPVFQSLFYAPYSLCVYLAKFLLPINQTGVYEYPLTAHGTLPFYIYFSPLIFLVILILVWQTWKNQKYVTFGILFFLATIAPVMQFLPVGDAVVAERYTYIPYTGLGLIVAIAFWEYVPKMAPSIKRILIVAGIFLLVALLALTMNRTMVWKDSIVFWTDVLEKNPRCERAFTNRAFMYNEKKDYDNALRDLTNGIKIDPTDSKKQNFYASRALIYSKTGKYDSAVLDYSTSIKQTPDNFKLYLYRGIIYTENLKKYDSAIQDFKYYLKGNHEDKDGIFNLGIAFFFKNSLDSAKKYLTKSVEINPANGNAHNFLAYVYYRNKNYPEAYNHGKLAKQYGVNVDSVLMTLLKNKTENKIIANKK